MTKYLLAPIITLIAAGLFYRWLFEQHGLTVTSHWRSPFTNKVNDGKPLSLHLIGMAWDIRTRGVQNLNEKIAAVRKWLPWGRFVVESDHIHIQFL